MRRPKQKTSKPPPKLLPGQSQKIKVKKSATTLPNPTKISSLSSSNARVYSSTQPSGLSKGDKGERIITGLRYKTHPISHLTGSNSSGTSEKFRTRSHAETGKSTPVARSTTSRHPRSKSKGDTAVYPSASGQMSTESLSDFAPDSLFDVSCWSCFCLKSLVHICLRDYRRKFRTAPAI